MVLYSVAFKYNRIIKTAEEIKYEEKRAKNKKKKSKERRKIRNSSRLDTSQNQMFMSSKAKYKANLKNRKTVAFKPDTFNMNKSIPIGVDNLADNSLIIDG